MLGPGKYDHLCTYVRKESGGDGAIIIVLNGENGNGFSCQATPETTKLLPAILRDLAGQIEGDT